jgi:hypothetical protein
VAAIPHDFDGEIDGVAHVLEPGRPARSQLGTLHHAGVQLHDPVQVQAGSDTGIEERLVFHEPDRREDRGERSAANLTPAGVARALDGRLPAGSFVVGDWAGSAVDDERRPD